MILTAGTLRRATDTRLREHLPDALAAVAAQEDIALPTPRTWRRLADFEEIIEQQSPACVTTTPGIDGTPSLVRGVTRADWLVRVFFVVRGRTYEETADRVAGYVAAGRLVLLGWADLGGIADGVQWAAETYSELASNDTRTVGAGSVTARYLKVRSDATFPRSPGGGPAPLTEHLDTRVTRAPLT